MGVCIASPRAPLRGEADGHTLDAVEEVGPKARHGPGWLDVGQPAEDLLEDDLDLEAGEVGAETEGVAEAEGGVVGRGGSHIEALGGGGDFLVAVGGDLPQPPPASPP